MSDPATGLCVPYIVRDEASCAEEFDVDRIGNYNMFKSERPGVLHEIASRH